LEPGQLGQGRGLVQVDPTTATNLRCGRGRRPCPVTACLRPSQQPLRCRQTECAGATAGPGSTGDPGPAPNPQDVTRRWSGLRS
jgi:hypothetical protein